MATLVSPEEDPASLLEDESPFIIKKEGGEVEGGTGSEKEIPLPSPPSNEVDKCGCEKNECDDPNLNGNMSPNDGEQGGESEITTVGKKMEAIVVVDEDEDVPANCDLVEENLYLGNLAAACDIQLLKKYRISYILTIDSCPLPTNIQDLPQVTTKFIKISDMPKEDILQYFEETNDFIDSALQKKKRVLVHCYYGVSRSATLVLAFLMKKHGLSLQDAQTRLQQRRSVVGPNYGFLSQLKLYEVMGYKIEKSNLFYKRFRLHVASDKLKAAKVLSTPYRDVMKADPALLSVSPEPVVYRCRKCRRVVACASNLLPHTEGKSPLWYDLPKQEEEEEGLAKPCTSTSSSEDVGESSGGSSGCGKWGQGLTLPGPICSQMLFIEPLVWMTDVPHTLQGKLHCPNSNCKSKLGSYSWVMGCLCPCGAKVQPAFYLVPSKVDRSTSVLNVQVTI